MLHQWDQNVDRPPVGDRLTARYYRHRRRSRQRVDRPRRKWWPQGFADWAMVGFALLFGAAWLLADWWTSFLPIGR